MNYYQFVAKQYGWPSWWGTKWITFRGRGSVIPARPGCYAIYADGVLAYIGQAVNVRSRLSGHGWLLRRALAGKEITVKVRFSERVGDWAMREIRLLKRLKPPQNVVFGSCPPRNRARASMGEF